MGIKLYAPFANELGLKISIALSKLWDKDNRVYSYSPSRVYFQLLKEKLSRYLSGDGQNFFNIAFVVFELCRNLNLPKSSLF